MGISAVGPVPGEELRDEHFAMGGDARSARSIQETARTTGSRAAAVFARERRFHIRHPARSAAPNVVDECTVCHHPHKFPKSLLEHFAAACPSHSERLQPGTWRFTRQRHHQRSKRAVARLHAGTDLARGKSAQAAERRNTQMARGRRSPNDHRLVSGRWLPRWLRRSERTYFVGAMSFNDLFIYSQ